MSFAYLLDPENQYMTKSGTINVNGFLRVFDASTDDPAVTYKDFNGTVNQENIILDNNGRAVVIADSDRVYRLEVYDRTGTLQWTTTPLWCQGTGGGGGGGTGGTVDIVSTNGSIDVAKTTVGSTTTFDLNVAQDSAESIDWIRTNGYTVDGSLMIPTYEDGTMEVGQYGITLRGGRYYHVTARLQAAVEAMPVYNEFTVTFSGMKEGEISENYITKSFIADCSTQLKQEYELSFDVKTGENAELYATVSGLETGVSVGLLDIEVHRVYSGVPAIPENLPTKAWVREHYQEILSGGPGIELSGNYISVDFDDVQGKLEAGTGIDITDDTVSVDFSEVQAKLEAGTGIDITDDTVSVDFSEVQAKLEAGANIVIDGNTISATAEPQLNADWDASSGVQEILNKPDLSVYAEKSELAQVAFSGDYSDLSGSPDLSVYATEAELSGYQEVLTAGDNITITNNVISATVPEFAEADWDAASGEPGFIHHKPDLSVYATEAELSGYQEVLTPGTGIDITNNTISVDTTTIATQSDLSTGLAGKQDTLTAGDNITITNNVISATAEPQVNADWDATSGVQEILNKPAEKELVAGENITLTESGSTVTISAAGAAQVNADWDATSGVQEILNKPAEKELVAGENITLTESGSTVTISAAGAAQVNADWDAVSGAAEILNKPTIRNVPVSTSADAYKVLTVGPSGDPDWAESQGLFVATYGQSTFTEIKNAFLADKIVYCAVRNGTGFRMAFLAYAYPSSNFEFQYVRSNSSAAGTDSVFIYKVDSRSHWTTTERDIKAGNISYPVTAVNVNGSSAMSGTVANITVPAQVNSDWDATSGISQILNKPDLSVYAQSADLAAVATTGSYNSLTDTPTIPAAQVNSDWDATSGVEQILHKPDLSVYAETSNLALVAFSGSYASLSDTPQLATVATSGNYNDLVNRPTIPAAQVNTDWDATSGVEQLLNKPDLSVYAETSDLAPVAFSGAYSELSGTPDLSIYAETSDLATVATTGSYSDLLDKPTIPAAQVNADWDATSGVEQILHKPDLSIYAQSSSLSAVATTGDYDDLLNKPTIPEGVPSYTTSEDGKVLGVVDNGGTAGLEWVAAGGQQVNSDWDAVSGVAEILNKPVQATLVAGSNITITELANTLTISSTSAPQVNADWDAVSGVAQILNKPTIPEGVPSYTTSEEGKVLGVVDNQGTAELDWVEQTGAGGADWDATSGEPGYIENRPLPKTLVAGTGITITESSSELTVASTNQLYNAGTGLKLSSATFSLDETVLYNNASGGVAKDGLSISEALTNFERIRMYVYTSKNSVGTPAVVEVPMVGSTPTDGEFKVGFVNGHNLASSFYLNWLWTMTFTSSTLTLTASHYWGFNSANATSGDNLNDAVVYKIVGINRIAP